MIKNKNFKRSLTALLGVLLLGTCLVGCSFFDGEADAKNKKAKKPDKEVTATVDEKKAAKNSESSLKPTKDDTKLSKDDAKQKKEDAELEDKNIKGNIFRDVRGLKTPLDKVSQEARNYAATEWKKIIPENEKFIFIDKFTKKLYLIRGEKVLGYCDCALGKNPGQKVKEGDMTTPHGVFPIESIEDASWWSHDFKDGKGEIKNAYGPWFIYLNTYELSNGKWDGIGIHGTNPDQSFVRTVTDDNYNRASEGCIRLLNDNVNILKKHAKKGMLVVIKGDANN